MVSTLRAGDCTRDWSRPNCLSSSRRSSSGSSIPDFGGSRRIPASQESGPPPSSKLEWIKECLKLHRATCAWLAAISIVELIVIIALVSK
jgi:hypothetical protein